MTDGVDPSQAVAAASDAAEQTQLVLTAGATVARLVAGGRVPAVRFVSTSVNPIWRVAPAILEPFERAATRSDRPRALG